MFDAMKEIIQETAKQKESDLSQKLCTHMLSPQPQQSNNFPHLSKLSIDPRDTRVVEGLVRDLVKLSESTNRNDVLAYTSFNNQTSTLVRFPESSSVQHLIRNEYKTKAFDKMLRAIIPKKKKKNNNKNNNTECTIATEEDALVAVLIMLAKKEKDLTSFKKAMSSIGYKTRTWYIFCT